MAMVNFAHGNFFEGSLKEQDNVPSLHVPLRLFLLGGHGRHCPCKTLSPHPVQTAAILRLSLVSGCGPQEPYRIGSPHPTSDHYPFPFSVAGVTIAVRGFPSLPLLLFFSSHPLTHSQPHAHPRSSSLRLCTGVVRGRP